MRRTLPPLNAARAFESAARNNSFTGAAEELRVSQGAVSRHVGCLEQWLQVKLFTRVHRGVELTPQGKAFYNVTKSALDLLESGAAQLKDAMPALTDGVNKLVDGAKALADGLITFDADGVSKLTSAINEDLDPLLARAQLLIEAAQSYNNYSGLAEGMDGAVRFIYRTDAIE